MFSLTKLRGFATRTTAQFKIYPAENAVKNRALVESIGETTDQRAFIAWHPKKEYPYEFTRPLPTLTEQINHSLIKDEVLHAAENAFNRKTGTFSIDKLSKLTFTCRHRWYPRSRDKKAKQTPMDRTYL